MKKRLTALIACLAVLFSMTGCSFMSLEVETQLRAPYGAGEQSNIQTALEQHIFSANTNTDDTTSVSYVLKYPKMGEYRSAFIMKDIDGDGVEDALAFYALQPEGANTHIALLKKKGNAWKCVEDIEGLATEIERVHFGDLNGDGAFELLAGFSMYDTRDRRLMLYTWEGDQLVSLYSDTYTHMIVGSIVEETRDDLLLFRLSAENEKSTVRLFSMEEGAVVEKGNAQLDGHILQFGNYILDDIDDHVRGVYQDCTKDVNTTITELIVWDGQTLSAPLYDPETNITSLSARESGIASTDIDLDGQVEWPRSYRFPGDEFKDVSELSIWLSEWYSWDQKRQISTIEETNIMNPIDGYFMTIPEEWLNRITASYDATNHRLIVKKVEDGVVGATLFKIVAFPIEEENPYSNENYLFLDSNKTTSFEIQYNKDDDFELSMDLLVDLFELYDIAE